MHIVAEIFQKIIRKTKLKYFFISKIKNQPGYITENKLNIHTNFESLGQTYRHTSFQKKNSYTQGIKVDILSKTILTCEKVKGGYYNVTP